MTAGVTEVAIEEATVAVAVTEEAIVAMREDTIEVMTVRTTEIEIGTIGTEASMLVDMTAVRTVDTTGTKEITTVTGMCETESLIDLSDLSVFLKGRGHP